MQKQRILVVGATGLVGAAAVDHFSQQDDWEVRTLSRRTPASTLATGHLAADLTDAETCRAAFGSAPVFTHVLYAALHEESDLEAGWRSAGQQETNLLMLRNLLDNVETQGAMQHLTILH